MKFLLGIALLLTTFTSNAQITVDEIIDNHFENTGGKANWEKLQGFKMNGSSNMQGMEIPIEIYQLKDGKQYIEITIQGKAIKQGVFDGEKLWNTNFMTQKGEEMPSEYTENFKVNQINDFPSPLLNYKEKGYTVELLGEETKAGTECYKVKLTQKPVKIEGKEEESVIFFYFDKESFIPLVTEVELKQGPMKGQMVESSTSDYEEVDGLYFPFSMSFMGMPITIEKIVLNPEIDATLFEMPKEETPQVEEKK